MRWRAGARQPARAARWRTRAWTAGWTAGATGARDVVRRAAEGVRQPLLRRQTEYSAWAITTSQGIILLDAIFDYSVEDEVDEGLTKLGLNPADIKYVIVSHGHLDHAGGAKYLQEKYGARLIMSAADYDLLDQQNPTWKPKRDMVATDGMKLTLGDTTLTLYLTPGHTDGTISTIFPLRDGSQRTSRRLGRHAVQLRPRTAAARWRTRSRRQRFRDIATKAGADVILSNHTVYDGSKTKLPAVKARKPGEQHPYVIGSDVVRRYLTVVNECAQAAVAIVRRMTVGLLGVQDFGVLEPKARSEVRYVDSRRTVNGGSSSQDRAARVLARPSGATGGGSSRCSSSSCSRRFSVTARGRRSRTRTTTYGPYLSPFYSPVLWGDSHHAWFGPKPDWWPALAPFSPALLILPFPGLFRFTCYYYRGAYYKAFWADPLSCAVGEPRGTSYWGERWFPLVLQNVHRYFAYVGVLFLVMLCPTTSGWRCGSPIRRPGRPSSASASARSCCAVNVLLLAQLHARLPLDAPSGRRPEGRVSKAPVRQACYNCSSALNGRHMLFAW